MRGFQVFFSAILFTLIINSLLFIPSAKANPSVSATWYASEDGAGTDCTQANPGALVYCVETKAQAGDTVYVKEGEYTGTDANNLLLIDKSLHLIGSCTWDDSGPVTCYPQNDTLNNHSSSLNGEYSRRVLAIQGTDSRVTIENFIIFRGNAHEKEPKPAIYLGSGGGIYAEVAEELVIKYNYFLDNRACNSSSGFAQAAGGGLYTTDIKHLEISHNTISFNRASLDDSVIGFGGGLYITRSGEEGKVLVKSNLINNNWVQDEDDLGSGGGAGFFEVENLYVENNHFKDQNKLMQSWTSGSALSMGFVDAANIDGNLFYNNYGQSTVNVNTIIANFTRNQFWENDSLYDFFIEGGNTLEVLNNFFGKWYPTSNGLFIKNDLPQGAYSTLVYLKTGMTGDPIVNMKHNTFAHADYAIRVSDESELDIKRNIFTALLETAIDNLDPLTTKIDVDENLFWDNNDNGITGETAWFADPKLVDPENGDFHLQSDSAAIDKVTGGTIHTDIDNNPRPIGSAIDLGADEFGYMIYTPLVLR
jgi:hypothetical protein